MRRFAIAIAGGALVLFGLSAEAPAQSLRDLPAGGNEICEGAAPFIEQGKAAGTPFAEIATGFEENACPAGGNTPPPDDGGGDENPLCGPLGDLIAALEDNDAPAELVAGLKQVAEGAGCAAGGDDEEEEETTTTTSAEVTTTTAGPTTTTPAVLGAQATNTGGGTALPATGGGLAAASAGISFLALSGLVRRFFFRS
ncbi:MAG TPA: hypothetical protein VM618_11020 [Acidimicrobiia bacterium]|nr:hypothetical protein [Acidimicrobiia bacterium]